MTRALAVSLSTLCLSWIACASDDGAAPSPGGGKADALADCQADGRYADGTCDADCAVPDLDCFLRFDDRAAAEAWLASTDALGLTVVTADDPDPAQAAWYARLRGILDRAWDGYREVFDMGELTRAPEIVVVRGSQKSFVPGDPAGIPWLMVIQAEGAERDIGETELTALLVHELAHAAQQHGLPEVVQRITRVYQADGEDAAPPFGFERPNDPAAQAALQAWMNAVLFGGMWALEELNGYPMSLGDTPGPFLRLVRDRGVAEAPAACARVLELDQELFGFLRAHLSGLDLELHVDDAARAELDALTTDYFAELSGVCLADATFDLNDLLGGPLGSADQALIEGLPVGEQVRALVLDRHATMRSLAAAPIHSRLRFHSTEDAADLATVPVLRHLGLDPAGAAAFTLSAIPAADRDACLAILDAGEVPPFGNLADLHHGACWGAWQIRAYAEATGPSP